MTRVQRAAARRITGGGPGAGPSFSAAPGGKAHLLKAFAEPTR